MPNFPGHTPMEMLLRAKLVVPKTKLRQMKIQLIGIGNKELLKCRFAGAE